MYFQVYLVNTVLLERGEIKLEQNYSDIQENSQNSHTIEVDILEKEELIKSQ